MAARKKKAAKARAKPKAKAKPTKPKLRRGPGAWRQSFLKALAQCGNVTGSAELAGIDRNTAYHAREADADFAEAWKGALKAASDNLVQEMYRRGVEGWDEPVYGSGGTGVGTVEVGTIRRYDHTLLIFLAKAIDPERFRERFDLRHQGGTKNEVVIYLPSNGRDQATTRTPGELPGNPG